MEFVINEVLKSITYILPVGSRKDCWLVDCGDIDKIVEKGWQVLGVLLTHAHFDHIYGLNRLIEIFPSALVYTNEDGFKGLQSPRWNFSRYHDEVEEFTFTHTDSIRILRREGRILLHEGMEADALFTPGHDPSCVSYHIENLLFTGDSYIPNVQTITYFPNSVKEQAEAALRRLKILEQRFDWKICPGHWIESNSVKET